MTLFEYLSIAISLVFSFSAVRLLGGLPAALDPARRYPVHVAFVVQQLFAVAAGFWSAWSLREVAWDFPSFLMALAGPGLLYYLAATLIPADPTRVESWRDYYYAVRRRYFTGFVAWAATLALMNRLLLHMPWSHPFRALQLGFAVVGVVGASSSDPRVHAALAIVLLALPVVASLTLILHPAPLAG